MCSMIASIDVLKKVGESAKGASSWQDWKFYQGSTNENEQAISSSHATFQIHDEWSIVQ